MGIFGPLIVCYLFLGGMGGGALLSISCLELANAPRIASRRLYLPREFFARAWAACVVVLGLAIACLVADLGRADRALALFVSPVPSTITVGAWSLAAALVLAVVFAAASLLDCGRLRERIALAGGVVGAIAGVVVIAYTGVLLNGAAAVLAWQTPLLVALFSLSGASCGIALCLSSLAFVESRVPLVSPIYALACADSAIVVLEAVCLAAYVVWLMLSPGSHDAACALVAGSLRWKFWLALVVAGLVLPYVMERFITYGNSRTQLLWVALCVFVGGLALRSLIVDISAFDVTQAASLAMSLVLM